MKKIDFSAKNITLLAYIVAEAVIYITFNVLSATRPDDPIYLKYAGVLLCLAVAAGMIWFFRNKDSIILTCALTFTAISDLFILVLDTYYQIGLITFIATQTVYLYRLYRHRLNKIKFTLIARALCMALMLAAVDVIMEENGGLNFMLAEVCIYIIMLVGNVIDAFLLVRRGAENILFAVGLLLFLCCDICVGLDNAQRIIGLNLGAAAATIQFLIWVFYLPSQVLIVLSGNRGGIRCVKDGVGKDISEQVENEALQG